MIFFPSQIQSHCIVLNHYSLDTRQRSGVVHFTVLAPHLILLIHTREPLKSLGVKATPLSTTYHGLFVGSSLKTLFLSINIPLQCQKQTYASQPLQNQVWIKSSFFPYKIYSMSYYVHHVSIYKRSSDILHNIPTCCILTQWLHSITRSGIVTRLLTVHIGL